MKLWRRLVVLASLAALGACGTPSVSERHVRATGVSRDAAVAGPGQYTVQRGDTLYSIAFRNQLDFHDLADWNNIRRDYTIYPGRVLRLTPPGGTVLPPPQVALQSSLQISAPVPGSTPVPMRAAPPQRPPPPEMPANSAPPPVYATAAASSDMSGPGFDSGRWEWPTRGKVVRGFTGDGSSKGLDIAGDAGQIVVAAAGGKVVYSGSALKGYGELVIIKHDDQYLSAYGYNRRRLVEEGQQVLAGQPIAEVGEGPEQRPLLHFEIRDRGRPVDPLPLLPKR